VKFSSADDEIPPHPIELRPYLSLVRRMVQAIRDGTSCEPGFSAGHRSVALMDACRESHASGAWIPRGARW
jgi:predicted dehydrogenase